MTLSKDAREWLEAQQHEFMHAYSAYFDAHEWQDTIGADRYDPDSAGWYSRLSAPGYMDATDWSGPYATEDESLEALYEMYGD